MTIEEYMKLLPTTSQQYQTWSARRLGLHKLQRPLPNFIDTAPQLDVPELQVPEIEIFEANGSNKLNKSTVQKVKSNTNSYDTINAGINTATTFLNNAVQSSGKKVTAAGVATGALSGAASGAALGSKVPGIGTAVGAIGGAVVGGLTSAIGTGGSVNEVTGEIEKPSGIAGLFGHSDEYLARKSSRIKNRNIAVQKTAELQANYRNDPRVEVQPPVLAKDGGVVPGEHYASRGEVEVAADGTNAVRYRWDPRGKDTYHVYHNPDGSSAVGNFVFTEEGVKRPNGEKYSDAAEKIIKSTEEGSKLRQISLRKLANEMEEQKMSKGIRKLKNGIPAHEGGLNPYGFNDDITQFAYWDKDKNDYKKEYLDWVNSITEQDVKDIYSGVYGDMSTYLGKNKGYIPTVTEARRLLTDKKYGDWHKIGQLVASRMLSKPNKIKITNFDPEKKVLEQMQKDNVFPNTTLKQPIFVTDSKCINDGKGSGKKDMDFSWAENIFDRIPLLAAYLNKPKYHIEESQTWIPKFRPVAVDINPQRRAIDDSMAIARYNQAHINPNTGAGMAYGLQAANNRAKQLADVYSYQTNVQNELIGQNVNIHNQWAPQMAAARYQAIADTRANEAAADAQRDMNIRDAMSYLRDEQIKPFLKQYLSSGAYNKSIKKLS